MAKKDNEALYQDFLADLEKVNPRIKEILDDATNAKLKEGVLARAEFSRQSDALAAREKEVEAYVAQEAQKVKGWQDWYGETTKQVAGVQNELKAYKEAYGDLDSTSKRQIAESHGMTTEDFDKKINAQFQTRDAAAISFVDTLTDLKIDHRDRFKEKLDTTALYKIAGERNLPLDVAYNLYIGDRVKEQQSVELTERIKKEREDAVTEYATKHNLPTISSSRDYVHNLDVAKPLTDRNERISAAVNDFMAHAKR